MAANTTITGFDDSDDLDSSLWTRADLRGHIDDDTPEDDAYTMRALADLVEHRSTKVGDSRSVIVDFAYTVDAIGEATTALIAEVLDDDLSDRHHQRREFQQILDALAQGASGLHGIGDGWI